MVERKETKEAFKKAIKMLKEFHVRYNTTFKTDYSNKTELFVDFVPFEQLNTLSKTTTTVIVVPLKQDSKASDAVSLIGLMQNHLWVGLNRVENAVLGSMQLMDFGKNFEKRLLAFRKQVEKKVLDADKKEFYDWNVKKK